MQQENFCTLYGCQMLVEHVNVI